MKTPVIRCWKARRSGLCLTVTGRDLDHNPVRLKVESIETEAEGEATLVIARTPDGMRYQLAA